LISSTFYEQLLPEQILKVQKDTEDLTVFMGLWDLRAQKLVVNMFVKFTLGPKHKSIMNHKVRKH
jgi:hypothetical protein